MFRSDRDDDRNGDNFSFPLALIKWRPGSKSESIFDKKYTFLHLYLVSWTNQAFFPFWRNWTHFYSRWFFMDRRKHSTLLHNLVWKLRFWNGRLDSKYQFEAQSHQTSRSENLGRFLPTFADRVSWFWPQFRNNLSGSFCSFGIYELF